MKTEGRAHEALRFIRALYRIERQIRSLSDAERHEHRQLRSLPVLESFKVWLDVQANAVLPKSSLGNAVQYALKNWQALTRYTECGYLEADNNFAERWKLSCLAIGFRRRQAWDVDLGLSRTTTKSRRSRSHICRVRIRTGARARLA
jgi:transposase IS66 family protein